VTLLLHYYLEEELLEVYFHFLERLLNIPHHHPILLDRQNQDQIHQIRDHLKLL
jgi:hypothetical protein